MPEYFYFVRFLNTPIEYGKFCRIVPKDRDSKAPPISPEDFKDEQEDIKTVKDAIEGAILAFQNQDVERLEDCLGYINFYAGYIQHECSVFERGGKIERKLTIRVKTDKPGRKLERVLSTVCRGFMDFFLNRGLDKIKRCKREGCGKYFTKVGKGGYKKEYCTRGCASKDYEAKPKRKKRKREHARERRKASDPKGCVPDK